MKCESATLYEGTGAIQQKYMGSGAIQQEYMKGLGPYSKSMGSGAIQQEYGEWGHTARIHEGSGGK